MFNALMSNCDMLRFVFVFLAVTSSVIAQDKKPKLVVGIVVDQMRQEYLNRFQDKFSKGGFNRMLGEGFYLTNAHYNYTPTVTGPGHASVYTGTTPAIHGIIGNDWYDKNIGEIVNCVNDPQQKPIGSAEGKGTVSPWRMLSTTLTDELKLATQKQAKVVGVSVKDRGAVLPAGHLPDGAYWYDSETGKFITSTYYTKTLPAWAQTFNSRNLADQYLNKDWTTLFPIDQYKQSGPDASPYEQKLANKPKTVFPYVLKELRGKDKGFDLLPSVPFANDYVTEFAKAALDGEALGKDDVTDFLAISYSSTDIIGHAFGPNSVEVQDTYLRLDRNIEDLLKVLDEKVGAGNYTVFLTADHAVADVAQYLKDNRIPAGTLSVEHLQANLKEYLAAYFPGKDLIKSIDDDQIFFNHEAFNADPKSSGVQMMVATELVSNFLIAQEGVANVFSESMLRQSNFSEGGIKGMVTRGYHAKRSGDIIMVLEPGWYASSSIQGTTHGSPYSYDTHVPIMFFGAGIRRGRSVTYHSITDIAPTISTLLNIKFPNGCTGQPIAEIFEE